MTNSELQVHVKRGKAAARWRTPAPQLVCADGFSVSVQASTFHYSLPANDEGPYTHFELGYPSEPSPELEPYEDSGVYPRVPLQVVLDLLNNHGGVPSKETK